MNTVNFKITNDLLSEGHMGVYLGILFILHTLVIFLYIKVS